jgi:hypothetical protein
LALALAIQSALLLPIDLLATQRANTYADALIEAVVADDPLPP